MAEETEPTAGRTDPVAPTEQTDQADQTDQTDQAGQVDGLRELIGPARVVLFDFDGPICRLFARHKAERVAADMIAWVAESGLRDLLSLEEQGYLDPQMVLRAVDTRHPGSDLVVELEERLTKEELRAAASAWPTAFADPLIRTWASAGARLAVTTNNAPQAVHAYLRGRGIAECFEPHVYGRTGDLRLLKPDPYCLRRALNATGTAPGDALMIGDNPSDHAAAVEAGVPFLGYAPSERKAKLLGDAGAAHVVTSLHAVLETVRDQARPHRHDVRPADG